MSWIESHQEIERHPKTLDLTTRMGWDVDTTIAKLHRFWWWCVDYAEDGDLRKHNDSKIALAVGLNGDTGKLFVRAMAEAGWLDRDPYFRVHDWWDYIGRFLQVKYKHSPDKWQAVRKAYLPQEEKGSGNGCKNGSKNHITKPNQTNPPLPPFAELIPAELRCPEFDRAWCDWDEHRRQRGPKLTEKAVEMQMAKMKAWGVPRSVAAIRHSIAGSYQGIFEDKNGSVAKVTPRKEWASSEKPYLPG